MAWIKRNLFFVIGGILALGLLGGSGFYIYQGWSRNSAASDKLNESYNTLNDLSSKKPGPGNDKINNTETAKDQEKQVRDWITSASAYFQPISPIPTNSPVTSEAFAAALRRTVAQLQSEADTASVALPPKYDFSFAAQRQLMQFAPGSLGLLSAQLGEVKAMAEIIFSARVNALDGIQRVRVSDDDASGPQSDYVAESSVTNDLAVLTPYIITFRSFTPELSRVISAFATSSNAFIIKSINVQPAGAATGIDAPAGGMPFNGPGGYMPPGGIPQLGGMPPPMTPPPPSKGGLQTILKEQLLRITIEVELVKLLPKS
jgi:hypothetical protein